MLRIRFLFLLTFAIIITLTPFVHAQSVIQIPFNKKLGPENGLSSYNASKVLQDRYGFTWIATQDGLNRYDGHTIMIYNKSSRASNRLLGNVINDIVEDTTRDLLWVTTSYGGLNGIDLITGRVVHTLKSAISKNGFQNDWLKCINAINGLVWIGTYDGLYLYDPDKRELNSVNAIPAGERTLVSYLNVNVIYTDRYEHVWVLFPDIGMSVLDKRGKMLRFLSCKELSLYEKQSHLQFGGRVARMNDTSFLLATDNGLTRISYTKALERIAVDRNLPVNKQFGNLIITSCAVDKNGLLWFGVAGHLYRTDLQQQSTAEIKDMAYGDGANWLNAVFYIYADSQQNIWLGTPHGVAFARNAAAPFIPYFETADKSIKINHAYYVFPYNDSLIFVCAQNGFYEINRMSGSIREWGKGASFDYIFRHPDNHLIVSGENGLKVYQSGRFIPASDYYPELKSINTASVNSVVYLKDNTLILGSETNDGIYLWSGVRKEVRRISLKNDDFPNTIINNIYKDGRGQIWVLYDNTIAILDTLCHVKKRWQPEDPDLKAPMNIFFDICEAGGYYWIAVYGKGVVKMDRDFNIRKIYTGADGLLNTGVYKVIPYRDSTIFVTSNNGLYAIDIRSEDITQYLKGDGLNTSNFEEKCGYIEGDEIFVGGIEGISVVQPSLIRNNPVAPTVYINRISMQRRERTDSFNLLLQSVDIPNDVLQSTVSFSAINYSNPSRTIFAYRLKERNDEWIGLGTQNFVDLIGIAPGTYTLEVKAANESNVWSEPVSVTLYIQPKWYQTWAFKIAIFILVILICYAIYYVRMNQLRKQQEIRRNFANDLHDDIGSTLNSVKIFTHMAMRDTSNKSHLVQIEDLLQQAATGIRDMIWVLDDSQDNVNELLERLKKFALPVTLASGIAIEFTSEMKEDGKLNKREKRNLLLLMKEAVNNAVKHAGCTMISIACSQVNRKRIFVIKDNGRGFDPSKIVNGNGLGNMKERAQQAGYALKMTSGDKGTIITLTEY